MGLAVRCLDGRQEEGVEEGDGEEEERPATDHGTGDAREAGSANRLSAPCTGPTAHGTRNAREASSKNSLKGAMGKNDGRRIG